MNLDFNTITDERSEEIAELFDQFVNDPTILSNTHEEAVQLFVEKYINTPEELFVAATLFNQYSPI